MKKELKLTYLKKAKKFLDKNKNVINEKQVDELIIKFIKKHFFNYDENIDYKQLLIFINYLFDFALTGSLHLFIYFHRALPYAIDFAASRLPKFSITK